MQQKVLNFKQGVGRKVVNATSNLALDVAKASLKFYLNNIDEVASIGVAYEENNEPILVVRLTQKGYKDAAIRHEIPKNFLTYKVEVNLARKIGFQN